MPRSSQVLPTDNHHHHHMYSKSEKTKKPFPPLPITTPRPLIAFSIFCLIIGISGTIFSLISLSRQTTPVIRCGRVHDSFRDHYLHGKVTTAVDRPKVLGFVGIQTAFQNADRRLALRSTWFASSPDSLLRLEQATGLAFRFVIGRSKDAKKMSELSQELDQYKDFMLIDVEEEYAKLPYKTLAFFKAAFELFDADYYVKADDDIYLRPDRLATLLAKERTTSMTYIGCMKKGPVITDPKMKWYESQGHLIGNVRDLAIHLSSSGNINQRRRLLMPRRERELPREWERKADQPFNAQIVSIHTGKMQEMEWFSMSFPKAEVLILNFSSNEYFLPPFIDNMPNLRALILINHTTAHAILRNFSVFTNMTNLRSLWFERISMPEMPENMIPLQKLRKISLVLCKIDKSFDPSIINLPRVFPNLSELTIDHCTDLVTLPETICLLHSLTTLSITNCHNLRELPSDIGKLDLLQILRVYACPNLKTLPSGMCQLLRLKYLDISQCVNLSCLPNEFGRLARLEKIDMRECCHIMTLPESLMSLQSLRHVICDEDISWMWEEVKLVISGLRIQVVEESFDLDWLTE